MWHASRKNESLTKSLCCAPTVLPWPRSCGTGQPISFFFLTKQLKTQSSVSGCVLLLSLPLSLCPISAMDSHKGCWVKHWVELTGQMEQSAWTRRIRPGKGEMLTAWEHCFATGTLDLVKKCISNIYTNTLLSTICPVSKGRDTELEFSGKHGGSECTLSATFSPGTSQLSFFNFYSDNFFKIDTEGETCQEELCVLFVSAKFDFSFFSCLSLGIVVPCFSLNRGIDILLLLIVVFINNSFLLKNLSICS